MLEKNEPSLPNLDDPIEMRENPPPAYFSILFYGLILWAAAFMAYFLFSGWSSEKEFGENMAAFQKEHTAVAAPEPAGGAGKEPIAAAAVAGVETDKARGKELFATNCAVCHGPEGKGKIGPDLTARDFKYGRTIEAITESITRGRPGGMPNFGNQLSSGEIASLAGFVESL